MSRNRRKSEPSTASADASAQMGESDQTEGDSESGDTTNTEPSEPSTASADASSPMGDMPSGAIVCTVLSNLHHDGGEYRPGDNVKLWPSQADELSKLGIVKR